jgi:hypothetical protein
MKELSLSQALGGWEWQERCMLEVLRLALCKLREQEVLPQGEPELNREFFRILRHDALPEWERENDFTIVGVPVAEAQNQASPLSDSGEIEPREYKRPDGTWSYKNSREPIRGERAVVGYNIECKRLRHPSEAGFKYNEEYVSEGISRFVEEEAGYGEGISSSVMVGYVQAMQPEDILTEVNGHATSLSLSKLECSRDKWFSERPNRLDQSLHVRDIYPPDFDLRHLWIDLRSFYSGSASGPASDDASEKKSNGG